MRAGVGLRLAHTPVCTAANLQGYDPGELVQVFGAEACQHPRTNALISSSSSSRYTTQAPPTSNQRPSRGPGKSARAQARPPCGFSPHPGGGKRARVCGVAPPRSPAWRTKIEIAMDLLAMLIQNLWPAFEPSGGVLVLSDVVPFSAQSAGGSTL